MMNLPQLPSDSLYKLITIGGLALIVSSVVLPPLKEEVFHREYTEQLEKTNQLFRDVQDSIQRDGAGSPLDEKRVDYAAGILMSEKGNLDAWLTQRKEMLARIGHRCSWAFWGGAILCAVGVVAWYLRVQRYVDAVLKKDGLAAIDAIRAARGPGAPKRL